MKRILFTTSLLLFALFTAAGQADTKKQYRAERISVPPSIDGKLDDEAWKAGTWVDDFTQFEPYNGKKPSQKTEFKILFDNDNIYAAFKAYDSSPDSVMNRLTRRDQPDGDLVGVIFDSYHDLRTAFLFGISSSGVKYDQIYTNDGQNEDSSWDPNWWVKTSACSEGWIAEMKIPFSQLRFDKNSNGTWGLEVARTVYRRNETSFWQHIPKDAPGIVHVFGELTGLENIKPRKIFDVTPYSVAKAETFKKDPENPFSFMEKGRRYGLNGGLDAKIGVTNNMTLDLSVNPDFGQVEADPSEVNLTAYETYFSEKRPFFIEGNNITNFNIGVGDGEAGNDNLFYSRRIGRSPQGSPDLKDGWEGDIPAFTTILGAAKLTGKTKNGLSLGFIDAVTAEMRAQIDTTGHSIEEGAVADSAGGRYSQPVEPLTNYFIGRVQRDFKEGNTLIGGIFTSTNRDLDANLAGFMHKSAYTGGIDFTQYFKKKSWSLSLNTALSQVTGTKEAIALTQKSSARYYQRPDNTLSEFNPDRTSLVGSGGRLQISKLDGHLNLMGVVKWKTPGFEINDLGYMQQADEVLSVIWAGYHEWEPKGIYRSFNAGTDVYLVNNFAGDITGKGYEWNVNMNLRNYWSVWTGGNLNGSALSTGMLRGGQAMKMPGAVSARFGFSSDYRKKFVFEYYMNGSAGLKNNSNNLSTQIELSYKPTNYLTVEFTPSISKSFNELQYVTKKSCNGEDRYIFSSIDRKTISASFRVNFNLTPDLTLQYWGQPYIASGNYYDHKFITDPKAREYSGRFHVYSATEMTYATDHYEIDENHDGNTDYNFDNNNFNYQFFLSNLVIRWEYNPGSTVYLVWSQSRNFFNDSGRLDYFNDLGDLFNRENNVPHNVFLIKLSYRFGLR